MNTSAESPSKRPVQEHRPRFEPYRSMTTNELAVEKRIADEPPVPSPESLAFSHSKSIMSEPPNTHLLLEGISSEKITTEFLTDVMDLTDAHRLSVEGVSLLHREQDDE